MYTEENVLKVEKNRCSFVISLFCHEIVTFLIHIVFVLLNASTKKSGIDFKGFER